MGYIKEPEGVDFVIKSEPLTNEERIAISEFIRSYKEKKSRNKKSNAKVRAKTKQKQLV